MARQRSELGHERVSVRALGALAILLVVCSLAVGSAAARRPLVVAGPAVGGEPVVPAASIAKDSRMDVLVRGRRIPLRNGGRVILGRDLTVELFLDPYPPTKLRAWLDLYVTRGRKAKPVTNASASMDYGMHYMYHGTFKASAKNVGRGHYLFTLNYLMYGGWDQLVTIRTGSKTYELPILVVASPGG